jgi:hypothetical protein
MIARMAASTSLRQVGRSLTRFTSLSVSPILERLGGADVLAPPIAATVPGAGGDLPGGAV